MEGMTPNAGIRDISGLGEVLLEVVALRWRRFGCGAALFGFGFLGALRGG